MRLAWFLPATPWILAPLIILWRVRRSRSLDDEAAAMPASAPLVSVIIPARDEAHNIERCVSSVLATDYPRLEAIVVDDHSADDTRARAERLAAGDPRLTVIANPDLPDGWFGKQWACATGAARAGGDVLLFADADTVHAPDLVTRAVNAMGSMQAGVLSVAGRQELGSFWERVVQPQVFAIMAMRYGGTEHVTHSRFVRDKIANGQCLLVRRDVYESFGGHGAVRDTVAEDLAMAQLAFARGHRVALVMGVQQLSTRMYTGLREIIRGWRKNIFAGGRAAVPLGAAGRAVYPVLLFLTPIVPLIPLGALALVLLGVAGDRTLAWSALAVAASLLFWGYVYLRIGRSPLYAFTYPLASLVILYIAGGAIRRGENVSWKGRAYVSK